MNKVTQALLLLLFTSFTLAGSFSGSPFVPGNAFITGGSINNAVIGATTPAAGTFSTLASSSVSITGGTASGVAVTWHPKFRALQGAGG